MEMSAESVFQTAPESILPGNKEPFRTQLLEAAGACKLRTEMAWNGYCICLHKRGKPQRIEFQLWVQLEELRGLCPGCGWGWVRADADEEVFRQMLQCASVIANLCFNMMA